MNEPPLNVRLVLNSIGGVDLAAARDFLRGMSDRAPVKFLTGDETTIKRLLAARPEALKSRAKVTERGRKRRLPPASVAPDAPGLASPPNDHHILS